MAEQERSKMSLNRFFPKKKQAEQADTKLDESAIFKSKLDKVTGQAEAVKSTMRANIGMSDCVHRL